MEIILLKNYKGLGEAGDIVSVKSGFARNKLIPDGIALRASKRNLAISEERKVIEKSKKIRQDLLNEAFAKKLSKTELTIQVQVGDEDKMFGSVTSSDIQKSLNEKGISIDRDKILLDEPIKVLGIFHVPIRVEKELISDVKLYVIKP